MHIYLCPFCFSLPFFHFFYTMITPPPIAVPKFGPKIYYKIEPFGGCRNNTKYEKGKVYIQKGVPILTITGFHAGQTFLQGFNYYPARNDNKYWKVRFGGCVDHNNKGEFCSNEMFVVDSVWDKLERICCLLGRGDPPKLQRMLKIKI